MAPPPRITRPLPTPEISPPNSAQSSRSVPASGEARETSMGSTSVISHALMEYTSTA